MAESCVGTAFEFSEDRRSAVEALLRKREGTSFSLIELRVRLPDGREVQAMTPVNNPTAATYIGRVPVQERAAMVRTAKGQDGECTYYVRRIHEQLCALEIIDEDVSEFARVVDAR